MQGEGVMNELTRTVAGWAYAHDPKTKQAFDRVADEQLIQATKAINRMQNKLTAAELRNVSRPRKRDV